MSTVAAPSTSRDVVFKIYNKTGIDHLLSQPMSDEFDDVSSKRLKAHYQSRFANYTNIYFSGLHPDLTYFGGFGQRVTSPLGDYHSRIILACFFQGRSVRECLAAFNGGVYEKLGYFLQFEHSLAELARRGRGKSDQVRRPFRRDDAHDADDAQRQPSDT